MVSLIKQGKRDGLGILLNRLPHISHSESSSVGERKVAFDFKYDNMVLWVLFA